MMNRIKPYLAIFLIFCSLPHELFSKDEWTGWLGNKRDGKVNNFVPPLKWPEKLVKKWGVQVGTGYGSPIVSGENIYVHTREKESEVLISLDRSTGDINWKKSWNVPFTMGGGGEFHGKGPKSCPVLSDGRIFTMSISGFVSAWDAKTGNRLWKKEYGKAFLKPHPYWGATTSPIVYKDKVYAHFGSCDNGAFHAMDVKTGNTVWSKIGDGACYSSPHVIEIAGVTQVVEWNHNAISSFNVKNGKVLWEFDYPHVRQNQNMPTPAYANGHFFVGGENRGFKCIKPFFKDGEWRVEQVWFQRRAPLDMSSPIISGKYLYGLSHFDRGRIFCIDSSNGEILWQSPERTGENATFLSIPGHIIALLNNGELRVVKAQPESYEVVAKYQVSEEPTWAPPVLLSDGLLIKDKSSLIFYDIPSGKTIN